MGGKKAERDELGQLFSAAYEELRRLAAGVKRGEGSQTLSPNGLVNEAWMRLALSPQFAALSFDHFKRIVARVMRQVLVDAARRRKSLKRGGEVIFVTFDEATDRPAATADQVLKLEERLDELEAIDELKVRIVECRFFADMTVEETARALGISKTTVEKEWRAASAWLKHRLKRDS